MTKASVVLALLAWTLLCLSAVHAIPTGRYEYDMFGFKAHPDSSTGTFQGSAPRASSASATLRESAPRYSTASVLTLPPRSSIDFRRSSVSTDLTDDLRRYAADRPERSSIDLGSTARLSSAGRKVWYTPRFASFPRSRSTLPKGGTKAKDEPFPFARKGRLPSSTHGPNLKSEHVLGTRPAALPPKQYFGTNEASKNDAMKKIQEALQGEKWVEDGMQHAVENGKKAVNSFKARV